MCRAKYATQKKSWPSQYCLLCPQRVFRTSASQKTASLRILCALSVWEFAAKNSFEKCFARTANHIAKANIFFWASHMVRRIRGGWIMGSRRVCVYPSPVTRDIGGGVMCSLSAAASAAMFSPKKCRSKFVEFYLDVLGFCAQRRMEAEKIRTDFFRAP